MKHRILKKLSLISQASNVVRDRRIAKLHSTSYGEITLSRASGISSFCFQWIRCAYGHKVATIDYNTRQLFMFAYSSHHWTITCMHIHSTAVYICYVNSLWSCGRHTWRIYNTKDWMTRFVSYRIATAHSVNSGRSKLLFTLFQSAGTRSCTSY